MVVRDEFDHKPVKIDSGLISGTLVTEYKNMAGNPGGACHIHCYKSVPYAAPPLGNFRWKPPQPVKPWKGVKACVSNGPLSLQEPLLKDFQRMPQSEDSLYLNIWTPAASPSERLPVLFWIHGGGFFFDGASQPLYDGCNLARQGAVVITLSHRLGVMAYLAHPWLSQESGLGKSGNYGALDWIRGLKWVEKNIAAFGGDPNTVTVFGQSSGGMAIIFLMVSPLAEGLIKRAIVQSGTGGLSRPLPLSRAEKQGEELVARLGCQTLEELRAKDPAEILTAAKDLRAEKGYKWEPIIDGNFLTDQEFTLFTKDKRVNIPIILGNTPTDCPEPNLPLNTPQDYHNFLDKQFESDAEKIMSLYPLEGKDTYRIKLTAVKVLTSATMGTRARYYAGLAQGNKTKPQAFLYQWSRWPPGWESIGRLNTHMAELFYVFGNLGIKIPENPKYTEWDYELSNIAQRYWVQFAKTGNPNNEGLPEWPAYNAVTMNYIDFDDFIQVKSTNKEAFGLFIKIMEKSYE